MPNPTVDVNTVGERERLLQKYLPYRLSSLSEVSAVNGCYTSKINDLSLNDFVVARQEYCNMYHFQGCTECPKLISAAKCIISEKVVKLQSVFVESFLNKGSKYKTDKAVKRLLQLPVIVFPLQEKNTVTLYVTESDAKDCKKLLSLSQSLLNENQNHPHEVTKAALSIICDLASSGADTKLIKYTALLASGASLQQARKMFGISEASKLRYEVLQALESAAEIPRVVNKLSLVQEKCALESLGIVGSEESNEGSENEDECDSGDCLNLSLLEPEELCEGNKCLHNRETILRNDMQEDCFRIEGDNLPICGTLSCVSGESHRRTETCDLAVAESLCQTSNKVSEMSTHENLLSILREKKLNWFALVMELKLILREFSSNDLNEALVEFTHFISSSDVTRHGMPLFASSLTFTSFS